MLITALRASFWVIGASVAMYAVTCVAAQVENSLPEAGVGAMAKKEIIEWIDERCAANKREAAGSLFTNPIVEVNPKENRLDAPRRVESKVREPSCRQTVIVGVR